MRKGLTILSFFLSSFFSDLFAQLQADNWVFNYGSYVSFHHGSFPDTIHYPVSQGGTYPQSGSISYSDKNGNMLFYGSGSILYDRTFHPFPSLDPTVFSNQLLYGSQNYLSASQTILAVPYPAHDSLYIVFHIRCGFNNNYQSPLYYSIVNMNLRGGLGEIEPGQKNIPLLSGSEVSFKLTSVLHCNKRDIWIVGHLANSDQYFSLLVTANGISAPQYFQGNFIPYTKRSGCVKVSALGNRLAAAYVDTTFVEIMDFNTQTGMGSNLKTLNAVPKFSPVIFLSYHSGYGAFGVEFSPTGNELYLTSNYDHPSYFWAYIMQYDATLPTAVDIENSQFKIDSLQQLIAGGIQIGNNGKMYVNVNDHLFEIASPENSGASCGYTPYAVISGSQYPNRNLPTFLQSYFRYPIIATGNCQFQNVSFSIQNPVGISAAQWDFGDPATGANNISASFTPAHIFSSEGLYTVRAVLTNSNGCGADTITKVVHAGPFKVYLGNDTTICQGDTLQLKVKIPGAWNTWSNYSNDTIIKVTQSGIYWIRVNLGDCSASDTITISVRSLSVFSLGNDTTICNNDSIILSSNYNPTVSAYLWSNGTANPSLIINSNGSYWLQLTDNYGCKSIDTISIQYRSLPNFSLGADTILCQTNLVLNATVLGNASYSWNTGSPNPQVTINQSGIYWADVTQSNCTYRDSIVVNFKPYPIVDLGNDTTLCESATLTLNAQNAGSTFQWLDNSISQTFIASAPGNYYVWVTTNGCNTKDTIVIRYDSLPVFSLGPDFLICSGQQMVLTPVVKRGRVLNYLWQDGSNNFAINVNTPGIYSLQLFNTCGRNTDTVIVSKGACKLYVPNAFTPNGDGLNDIFKASYGDNITKFKMTIYNRWGQKVFEANDINNGWNGTLGEKMLTGAFIWMIQYDTVDVKNQVLKGTVTRNLMWLRSMAIPACNCFPVVIQSLLTFSITQNGVLQHNISILAQDRIFKTFGISICTKMPLEVTDPKYHISNSSSCRILRYYFHFFCHEEHIYCYK